MCLNIIDILVTNIFDLANDLIMSNKRVHGVYCVNAKVIVNVPFIRSSHIPVCF